MQAPTAPPPVWPGLATVLAGARTGAQLPDKLGAVNRSLSGAELEVLDRVSQMPIAPDLAFIG